MIRATPRLPLACAALLALSACGGNDMPIDSEGVMRYGAFRYDAGAPAAGGGGGAAIAPVNLAQGAPAGAGAAPAAPAAAPGGGAPVMGKPKKSKYEAGPVEQGGTIKVTVKLTKAAEVIDVPFNKDQGAQKCGHDSRKNERALFDPVTLGLANTVVYLDDIAKGKEWDGDLKEADRVVTLDQKECHYVPHVMLVRPGAKVSVKNSDPVQHNAKGFYNNKATLKFNVMSSSNSELPPSDDTLLDKPGNYLLYCDIHLWMTGYIRAVPHPYYAVTGADGTCTLTNVPPGEYKIAAWHEGMVVKVEGGGAEITGYSSSSEFLLDPQTVTVPAGGSVDVTFTTDPK